MAELNAHQATNGERVSLTSTYRLQLGPTFGFRQVRDRLNYLRDLGVSHLYLSPILTARKGSTHGYDVVDPCKVNPELGGEEELRSLAHAAHERRLGLLVDIVPNHMGMGPDNARWDDVLAHGERSRYAHWFDIDWESERGKVVLPVLSSEFAQELDRGALAVRVHDGQPPRVWYGAQSFPLDPATLPPELQLATFDPEETSELTELFSGAGGRPRLRELLDAQHYRLVHWREGATRINYRRFFDVNDLVAVRVEDPAVFEESHACMLGLAADGTIDGLRVDHIDGLADPRAYLDRLRAALPTDAPLFVEKILSPGEQLPKDWPVDGTTGYEFLNDLEDVLIDPTGFARIEAFYRRLRRLSPNMTFRYIARQGKLAALRGSLKPDVIRLAALRRTAGDQRRATPNLAPLAPGEDQIAEDIADMQVYRTYDASPDPFVRRFQQLSGPATAKGVEDTAFYLYVPLLSRNEVGGAPDRSLANAVERFHAANMRRAERWPRSLIATNTHDTKRSADVRARLDALTEVANDWQRTVRRWRRLNARHKAVVDGRMAPDTNTEYLIYQTLVALWPPPRPGRRADDLPDRSWRDAVRDRLAQYATKAAREARTRTSWAQPNAAYERVLNTFVAAIMAASEDAPFLPDVARLVARLAPMGARNSLARVVLHLTSPGTPDLYQGDEQWRFTLVDPDNRTPVDWETATRALGDVQACPAPPALELVKLYVVRRLLALRQSRTDLFQQGSYEPLTVVGPGAEHVVAFARSLHGRHLLVVAARCLSGLVNRPTRDLREPRDLPESRRTEGEHSPAGWMDTRIELPESLSGVHWHSVLDPETSIPPGTVQLAPLLRTIPVAVLAD